MVGEFLSQVRRLVVEFVVAARPWAVTATGKPLASTPLPTTISAPPRFRPGASACGRRILYAIACGLSDRALADQSTWWPLAGKASAAEENGDAESQEDEGSGESSGGTVRLKPWSARECKTLGEESGGGLPAPLIDQIHRIMLLWKAGDVAHVDEYIDQHNLRQNRALAHVLQSLIELSSSDERALLESISNHLAAVWAVVQRLCCWGRGNEETSAQFN